MTTTDTPDTTEAETHEVTAFYDNLRVTRAGGNSPTLDCSCGRSFSADTWAAAGIEMDEHLGDVEEGSRP